MGQLWTDIVNLIKAPFVGDLDLWQLFMVVGAVIIFAALWVFILNHIRLAGMEV